MISTADGMVYGVEADSGRDRWSFLSGGALFSSSMKQDPFGKGEDHPFFIPGMNSNIYAFNKNSQQLKVTYSLPPSPPHSLLVTSCLSRESHQF